MAITENDVGRELCDILGLPENTRSVSIHVEANKEVRVDVTFMANGVQVDKLLEVMKRYKLVEKDEE